MGTKILEFRVREGFGGSKVKDVGSDFDQKGGGRGGGTGGLDKYTIGIPFSRHQRQARGLTNKSLVKT